ncbi:unnamed protein product [Arabis nemorensis]|uniref:Uncharacterized protein n=1 Tax=Arabis nemorensis TaxID=586526 RepID=A0A565B6Q7_9BRAS|nr:unnamed protein product [Arabis nemorensis]
MADARAVLGKQYRTRTVEGISYHVLSGRHKSLYSIYCKMLKFSLFLYNFVGSLDRLCVITSSSRKDDAYFSSDTGTVLRREDLSMCYQLKELIGSSVCTCDLKALEDALCKRVMVTPEEVIKRRIDQQSAVTSRDGLGKTHVFKMEEEEYTKEAIYWSYIEFVLCQSGYRVQLGKRSRGDLEEAKTQEIAKFTGRIAKNVHETNACLVKKRETAKKAAEEAPPVIKETQVLVEDTKKIESMTEELECKVKKFEEAQESLEERRKKLEETEKKGQQLQEFLTRSSESGHVAVDARSSLDLHSHSMNHRDPSEVEDKPQKSLSRKSGTAYPLHHSTLGVQGEPTNHNMYYIQMPTAMEVI